MSRRRPRSLRAGLRASRYGVPGLFMLGIAAVTPLTVINGGQSLGFGRIQQLGTPVSYAVAAVDPLSAFPAHAVVASIATDGVDGASDAAGGVVDQETAREAAALGLAPPAAFLAASDSTSFLGPVGGLIVTGPTGTNVVDLTLLLAGDAWAAGGR